MKNLCIYFLNLVWAVCLCTTLSAQENEYERKAREIQKLIYQQIVDVNDSLKKTIGLYPGDVAGKRKNRVFPINQEVFSKRLPSIFVSKGQAKAYLQKLYSVYGQHISPEVHTRLNKINIKYGLEVEKIAAQSLNAWMAGDGDLAIMLGITACKFEEVDDLNLNNLAAMLNLRGAGLVALPILRTLEQRHPENPMILNNYGQALAASGATDSAMRVFGRCLKKSPHHPEANNTAGQIQKSSGNFDAAREYFQNSLKGAYNEGAREGLNELEEGNSSFFINVTDAPVDYPYFNEFKYQLPRQCTGPTDAPFIAHEHSDFYDFISRVSSAYGIAEEAESTQGKIYLQQMQKKIMSSMSNGTAASTTPWRKFMTPIRYMASQKLVDLTLAMTFKHIPDHEATMQRLKEIRTHLINAYEQAAEKIRQDYTKQRSKYDCGEGNAQGCKIIESLYKDECLKLANLGNNEQPKISAAMVDIQNEEVRFLRWQFNQTAYYAFLSAPDEHTARAGFYAACRKYLNGLKNLVLTPYVIAGKRCDGLGWPNVASNKSDDKTKSPECEIDYEVPFIVGKFKLNCEELEFEAGEGLVFKMAKNYKTMQTTLSIGAGFKFETKGNWGVFKAGFDASIDQSFYATWNAKNSLTDFGMAIKAATEFKTVSKLPTEKIGAQSFKDWQKQANGKIEVGYKLGVNSGWTFSDAPVNEGIKISKILIDKYFPSNKK